jgi:hypothetical protein
MSDISSLQWQPFVRVRPTSAGVDLSTLEPGCDLVLEAPRAHGDDLPFGVLLDDWLSPEARQSLDREATERLAAWRERRDLALTVGGVCLSEVWEVELLAEVFLPETRIVAGLRTLFTGGEVREVAIHGVDSRRADCLRAELSSLGITAVPPADPAPPPRYPSGLSSPWRVSMGRRAIGALFRTIGLPQRVRGHVFVMRYWHLAPIFERLQSIDGLRPVLDPASLPSVGLSSLVRSARRGGWVGHPNAIDRRRSQRQLAAALITARDAPQPTDPLSRFLDARAITMLEQRAGDTVAIVTRMGRAFRSRSVKLAVLPFDSPPAARFIVQAAREAGIPTLVVQHGFIGEPRDPDKTLATASAVWSDADAIALRDRARGTIVRTGNPGLADTAELLRDPPAPRASGHTIVLVEYSSRLSTRIDDRVSMRHVSAALHALAAARPGTTVTIRPHPAEHEPEIFGAAASRYPELEVRVDTGSSIDELLATGDLVVGAVSTATLQAAAAGVPVIFLNVSGSEAPWPFDGSTEVPSASSAQELTDEIPRVLSSEGVPGRRDLLEALGVDAVAVDNVIALIRTLAEDQ